MKKNIMLALVSTLGTLLISTIAIEAFFSSQFDRWKSHYAESGDWYGGLTTVSSNPDLMWEYRRNSESNGLINTIRTNRYGFRDHDYESMSPPADVFRIAFIGDSVTLGLFVDQQDVFVRRFAARAAELTSGPTIQSLNFGIDGYNTIQIYELLRSRVLQFEPAEVVYVICLNDFDFEESSGGKMRYFNKPDSFVLEKLEKAYRRIREIEFHVWHFEKNKEEVFDTLLKMKRLLDAKAIDFRVVIIPIFASFKNADKNFSDYPLFDMHSEIQEFLTQHGIMKLDLLDAFRNQEKPPQYFAHDVYHPNGAGHEFIAQHLLNFVRFPRKTTAFVR